MRCNRITMVAVFTLALPALFAQNPNTPGQAVATEHRAQVSLPERFDTSGTALRLLPDRPVSTPPRGGRDFEPGRPFRGGDVNTPFVDPLAATGTGPSKALAVPIAAGSFGTPVDPARRVAPPDTTGDLSPTHYVQWVNLRYSVYTLTRDDSGSITSFNLVPGFPKNGNTIWAGFGGPCETYNDGDPIVQYDQLAQRWVLTQFAVSAAPYTQCIAVSTSSDPTGTWNRYAYSYGTNFNDFPKMGVWPDGYVITYNMFSGGRTFVGNTVCAFERDKMIAGLSARQICAQTLSPSLVPADLEGSTLPPAGSPNYLLNITSSALQFWRFSFSWAGTGSGTLSGPIAVPGAAAFSRACSGGTCIPQQGTTRTLDSLSDRLNYRLSYRNLGTREAMVINHSVTSGSTSGIRWYELTNATGQTLASADPVVRQQGTFAPDSTYRWMGSAAIDRTGGIAVGYNVSSASIKPGIRYAYRAPDDPLGTLASEATIADGTGSQTGTLSRWGDYSSLSVDPVDGCTMVFTTELIPADGSFNWTTYIYSFKLSTCVLSQANLTVVTPSTIPYNGTGTLSTRGGSGSGAVSYAITTGSANCSVSGSIVTGTALGTCTVVATKATDGVYDAVNSSPGIITVVKANQAALAVVPGSATISYKGTTSLSTTGGSGAGTVSYALAVATGGPYCSLSGTTLTAVKIGTCTVKATKLGDTNYNQAESAPISITVTQATQATLTAVAAKTSIPFNGTTTLSTTGGTGTGAVRYAVTTGDTYCAVSGTTLTGTGVGSCTVVGTKAADTNYLQASSAPITITVTKATQTALTAPVATPSTVAYGATAALSTSGGSGTGAVTYSVATGGANCSISGSTLTVTAVGNCTVVANKAADSNYNAATSSARTVFVTKAAQATLTAVAASTTIARNGTTTLSTTGGSGTGAVTYAVTAGGTNCTISGTTLTGRAVGTCTVRATKAADANYTATSSAGITITVQ